MSGLITHVNKLFISITKNAGLKTYSPYSTTAVTSVQFACFQYFINGYTVFSLYTYFYDGSEGLTKFTLERGGGGVEQLRNP